MVPYLHMMLKPASGLCNLRCRYCFYADETAKRSTPNYGMMSLETAENIIRKSLAHTTKECTFAFQGGEPTLAGLDFFRAVAEFARRHNVNGCAVRFALQTNGTLLDEAWCRFLAEQHFLVGVSLDGTKELHDANRLDAEGKGTYNRVVQALRMLERHKVETNLLTVLTAHNCRHFRKIYSHYAKNQWKYQQYIPCLDPLGEERGQHLWSLSPEDFEAYLTTAFDCWYEDAMRGKKTYHRYFDNLLAMLDGQPPEACGMGGRCGMQYVAEADGSVYPCDFYMLDRYRLGNLNTDSFRELDDKRRELRFVEDSAQLPQACARCQWAYLCRGGCRRDRDYFAQGLGENYFCSAYAHFFQYAYPRLAQLYRRVTMAPASRKG